MECSKDAVCASSVRWETHCVESPSRCKGSSGRRNVKPGLVACLQGAGEQIQRHVAEIAAVPPRATLTSSSIRQVLTDRPRHPQARIPKYRPALCAATFLHAFRPKDARFGLRCKALPILETLTSPFQRYCRPLHIINPKVAWVEIE